MSPCRRKSSSSGSSTSVDTRLKLSEETTAYTQPILVEIGEHQAHVAGGGTYRHVSVQFPNGLLAHVACVMTADGRAELRVGSYDAGVAVYAFDQLCERPV